MQPFSVLVSATPRHALLGTAGHAAAAVLCCALLTGCLSLKIDDSEAGPDDYATVIGDPKLRAGAPMALLLRKIDDRVVGVRYDRIRVPAGTHTLLVDCQIDGTVVSRHPLDVELYAKSKYRIVSDNTAGNRDCSNVRLEAVN